MTKAEAVSRYLSGDERRRGEYRVARKGRKTAMVPVPEALVPILLIALEDYGGAYALGPEAGQDRAVVQGLLMANLTPHQADALAGILGDKADYHANFQKADG